MRKNVSLFLILFLSPFFLLYSAPVKAGDEIIDFAESVSRNVDRRFVKKEKMFYTSFDVNANTQDHMGAIKLGMKANDRYNVYFNLFYSYRPHWGFMEEYADTAAAEGRTVVGFGLDKFQFITYDFGLFLSAGIGMTTEKKYGVIWSPIDGFTPLCSGGVFYYLFDYLFVRVGYKYMRVPNVIDSWGEFSLNFSF